MATITAGITATTTTVPVSAAVAAGNYLIDDEALEVRSSSRGASGRGRRLYLSVKRGVAGTTPAVHDSGATLTRYYPDAATAAVTAVADPGVPGALWRSGSDIKTSIPTATTTGTAVTGGVLESEIVTGGQTIILTLGNGGTWKTSTAFNAARQAIINGLTSAQSETNGWNARIKAVMAVTTVVRTNGTVCTITLPAAALYAITSNETITVTIPSAALAGSPGVVVASPTVVVTANP